MNVEPGPGNTIVGNANGWQVWPTGLFDTFGWSAYGPRGTETGSEETRELAEQRAQQARARLTPPTALP